ncbi:RluA family pseudouridine synthase [Ruminiclostridium cellulolyticum]|uniref:RNA pseudouridylate synthase n=1 Tax=Ruminiclostridium cellulolyticum (strain ATCC 35319 / DSM 5812 / JCM 6584 / H10) TaxID=394503 RepID=B8I5M5_RUMCH|nr:RNA pseudouridine synthase [Ruminiclostridium cellulolyticum]ACL76761.1 pseudouridine synthase [Ruminiclostridium cellulolyticum H10]
MIPKIVYEDNHLLVVEKPVNIPVQADNSKDIDMLTLLKQYLKEKYNKPGEVYLGLVHRLDRPVGGVMVFAKTSKCASRLSDQIRTRTFKKTYLAIVRGVPQKQKDELRNFLLKDSSENMVHVVKEGTRDAKEAILDYEVLKSNGELSLLQIQLHTGRPHQIRVQLSHSGYPLYGDQRYGIYVNKPGQQIALWASSLTLEHPTKKEEMTFGCGTPEKKPWTELV